MEEIKLSRPIFKNCFWIDDNGVKHKIPDTVTTPEEDKELDRLNQEYELAKKLG